MESRSSWKPVHHAIQTIISENAEPSLLSYELLDKLRKQGYISAKIDDDDAINALDETIWKHEESIQQGRAGNSLPMKIGNLLTKLKS